MSSGAFYRDLKAEAPQLAMCDTARHHPVPEDWTIIIVDIAGSTQAVAERRYKDVNIVSSCAIAAVINRVGRDRVCYIYGGDGATFLIPSSVKFEAASALYGTQEMVRGSFRLDMRAGMVDVAALAAEGLSVRVGKIETHPGVYQAALSGGGVGAAEERIKDPSLARQHAISSLFSEEELAKTPPSFEGFECRWEPLQSRNGVNVSLLVTARMDDEAQNTTVYQDVLNRLHDICGQQAEWRPVSAAQLDVSLSPLPLRGEVSVRTAGQKFFQRLKYWAHITVMTWVGWYCFRFGKKAGSFDGRTYKNETASNTDFMKFENALKIVMDVSAAQKDLLLAYLEEMHSAKKIFYGVHVAGSAVITCLVFNYEQDHSHFVDGADGGYTLAAKQLKQQMRDAA